MSEGWFEGVGLAESPFAVTESAVPYEVEALADGWPSEAVGLPPSWPEDEEDGGGELPLATEAWTPGGRAEPPPGPGAGAGEEGGGGGGGGGGGAADGVGGPDARGEQRKVSRGVARWGAPAGEVAAAARRGEL